jgi:hypothetical protein
MVLPFLSISYPMEKSGHGGKNLNERGLGKKEFFKLGMKLPIRNVK